MMMIVGNDASFQIVKMVMMMLMIYDGDATFSSVIFVR